MKKATPNSQSFQEEYPLLINAFYQLYNNWPPKDKSVKIENNKILFSEFPFLKKEGNLLYQLPQNADIYEYSWLDNFEPGWRKAFGFKFCTELKKAISKDNPEDFKIIEITEKFGRLRIYTSGSTENISKTISKYEYLSFFICGSCGIPAKYVTQNWDYPVCEKCSRIYHLNNLENIETFHVFELNGRKVEEKIKEIMQQKF